jgi:hypothetical protein
MAILSSMAGDKKWTLEIEIRTDLRLLEGTVVAPIVS